MRNLKTDNDTRARAKKNNKHNKYYAIQRGGILKTRKTRNTNLLVIKQI